MSLDKLKKNSSWGLLALRLAAGSIFLVQGISKLADIAGPTGMLEGLSFPAAALLAWVLAIVETAGGAMLILGLYSRIAAMPLAVIMLVAIAVKLSGGFGPASFEAIWVDLMLLAVMINTIFAGAGKWALKEA